jgi:hypothetical protein
VNNLFPQKPEPEERKSTALKELYEYLIFDQLDTIRDHQQMIGLLVWVKEGAEYYGETWQRADVYLKEERIYLERAVKDLAGLRETAKELS